jgi:hypothetical protein
VGKNMDKKIGPFKGLTIEQRYFWIFGYDHIAYLAFLPFLYIPLLTIACLIVALLYPLPFLSFPQLIRATFTFIISDFSIDEIQGFPCLL